MIEAELKPSALNRIDVWFDPVEKRPRFESIADRKNYVFDNGRMQVVINTRTGLVDSWKIDGTEYLKKNSFEPIAVDGTYNSWGLWEKEPGMRRSFTLLDCRMKEANFPG